MTLYEYYTAGDDDEANLTTADKYVAQVFTVGTVGTNEDFYIHKVRIKVRRTTPIGYVKVEIRDTTLGAPTTTTLTEGQILTTNVTTGANAEWFEIPVNSYKLESSGVYALVVYTEGVTSLYWRVDTSAASYGGGIWYQSVDAGATFPTSQATWDNMFEIHGSLVNVQNGTVNVGTGGIGTRYINKNYPNEEGTTAGITKQTGKTMNLVAEEGTNVPRRFNAGLN